MSPTLYIPPWVPPSAPDDSLGCPTTEAPASADDGFGCAVSSCGVIVAPGHVVPAIGTLDALSTAYPLINTTDGYASLVDPVVTPAMLLPAFDVVPDGSRHTRQRAIVFFGASFRRVLRSTTW